MKVKILDILDKLGVEYKDSPGSANVRAMCWNPAHQETKPSLFIHKETSAFQCFGCGISGNVFSILSQKGGLTGIDALQFISNFIFEDVTEEELQQELLKSFQQRRLGKRPIRSRLLLPKTQILENHPYLEKRGITPDEIRQWSIAKISDTSKEFIGYNRWIYIPILMSNKLRTYFLRSPFDDRKMYGPYPRRDILFGLDSAADWDRPLYIVEGIFDMISVRKTGEQAVAILSNHLLPEQIMLLKRYNKIVVIPDNDERGLFLVNDSLKLIHNTQVAVATLPQNKKDAGECSVEDIKNTILGDTPVQSFVSTLEYLSWYNRNFKEKIYGYAHR